MTELQIYEKPPALQRKIRLFSFFKIRIHVMNPDPLTQVNLNPQHRFVSPPIP
jgi:hypothetical protein